MQANGAEMLRLACCFATERGVEVCCPVHDAILIEAPADELPDAVQAAQEAMANAGRIVLDGFEVRTDVELTVWPDRFGGDRLAPLWVEVFP
jgi:DNA polymerase-1